MSPDLALYGGVRNQIVEGEGSFMKTNLRSSLLSTSVLSILLVSGVAHAEATKSGTALPPVKIQKSTAPSVAGVSTASVPTASVPTASVGPFVKAKPSAVGADASGKVPLSPKAKDVKDTSPRAQLPSAPVTVAVVKTAPEAKTAPIVKVVKVDRAVHVVEKASKLRVKTPVKIVKTVPMFKQKATIRSKDAAEAALNRCVATSKHVVGCMTRVLERAWAKLDASETRLMNCGELRKMQNNNEPSIEAFVVSKMYKIRQEGSQDLQASLNASGKVSSRMSLEIELRSLLKNTKVVTEFGDKVCDANEFQRAFAESATAK